MQPLQVLCVVLVTASVAHAQTVHLGRCPKPPVQQDFNVTKVTADAQKLPAVFEGGKCQQATYPLLRDRTHTLTHHRLYEVSQTINMNTHNQIFFKGEMWSRSQSQPHLARSPKPTPKPLPLSDPYLVLSIDYSSFSLVYSLLECELIYLVCSVDFAWIVSRTRSLPSDVISCLHGDLEAIGVDLRSDTTCSHYCFPQG
uniref:Apolipoprotein D n=1 Tax=Salmo trutta TaxID=8032 RepID=A0A673YTI5_SALTR